MVDFSVYLEFVSTNHRKTRSPFIVTDILLSLEVKTVEQQELQKNKLEESRQLVESFSALTGVEKYALGEKREHVLLVGWAWFGEIDDA